MADPKGFLTHAARDARSAARSTCASRTGTRSTRTSARDRSNARRAAAWTAASRSATRAARSATSSRSGTTWSTATTGARPLDRLHATNNFPEFTGRLCPAPCEAACVLGINQDPVTIKQVEVEIIDRAFAEGWVRPQPPAGKTGKKVAVVGSGPAGLAAAQQLTRAGHEVTVLRARRPHRRAAALRHPRVQDGEAAPRPAARADARPRAPSSGPASTSASTSPPSELRAPLRRRRARRRRHRLARPAGAGPRARAASTRRWSTCRRPTGSQQGDLATSADRREGKHVVIIGGGDTGADCLGTAHRQGAASVTQLEIMPRPPETGRPTHPGRPTR